MNEMTARAWRPQQFKDFVGQEYIVVSLKNSIQESKIAHGYMFSGPRGVGKTSIARVFSMALNCLDLSKDSEPCLKCKNCVEIREGRSPDVVEIDGASNRGIDDMRELRSNAQFMPSTARYKIYIVDEVHMLTTEAFNAILKILEEPPSYLLFIFATTEVHKVKSTIRSRCQQFYLKRLTQEEITAQLEKILLIRKVSYDKAALSMIVKAADGSMRDAQSILDQALIFSDGDITFSHVQEILGTSSSQEFLKALDILIAKNAKGVKELVSILYARGEDLEFWILQFLEFLRALLFFSYGAWEVVALEEEIKEDLRKRAEAFSLSQVQTLIDLFTDVFRDIRAGEREFFFFEGAFLKALEYRSFVTLGEIVEEIALLKDKEGPSPIQENLYNSDIIKASPEKEVSEKKTQSFEEAFNGWKTHLKAPKEQKILLDIKKVEYNREVGELKIEFLSKQGKEHFEQVGLPSSLLSWFQEQGPPVSRVTAFVEEVDFSKSPKKAQELSKQEVLDLFEKELQATEIPGESQ